MFKLADHANKLAFLIIAVLGFICFINFPDLETSSVKRVIKEVRLDTGLFAFTFLTLLLFLVIKNSYISKLFGQLDSFRLHKIFAIYTIFFVLLHIFYKPLFTEFLMHLYASNNIDINTLAKYEYDQTVLVQFLKEPSVLIAKYSCYLAIFLIFITIFQKISYRFFFRSHKLFVYLYLLVTLHMIFTLHVIRMDSYVGYILAFLLFFGLIASITIIRKQHNKDKAKNVLVKSYETHENVLKLTLDFKDDNLKEDISYIYYIKDDKHNYTPFSLAMTDENSSTFIIKKEHYFTKYLYENIENIKTLTVQGPFVEYKYKKDNSNKILYIASGTGIASFIRYLITNNDTSAKQSLLFIVKDKESGIYKFAEKFISLFSNKINIYVYESNKQGRISLDTLKSYINSSDKVYFSGSPKLKKNVKRLCSECKVKGIYSYTEFRSII